MSNITVFSSLDSWEKRRQQEVRFQITLEKNACANKSQRVGGNQQVTGEGSCSRQQFASLPKAEKLGCAPREWSGLGHKGLAADLLDWRPTMGQKSFSP